MQTHIQKRNLPLFRILMQLLKEQAWLKQWQDNQAGECLDVWRPIWDIGYLGKCLSRSTEEESLSTQASSGDFTQTTVHEIYTLVKKISSKILFVNRPLDMSNCSGTLWYCWSRLSGWVRLLRSKINHILLLDTWEHSTWHYIWLPARMLRLVKNLSLKRQTSLLRPSK